MIFATLPSTPPDVSAASAVAMIGRGIDPVSSSTNMMFFACRPASVFDCCSELADFDQPRAAIHQVAARSGSILYSMRSLPQWNARCRNLDLFCQTAISFQSPSRRLSAVIDVAAMLESSRVAKKCQEHHDIAHVFPVPLLALAPVRLFFW